jgi:hypothetical protein
MRFPGRRASLAPESGGTEIEPRRRNRLSKPHVGAGPKLSASTSALNLQTPSQSQHASTIELAPKSPLSPISSNAIRQQIREEMSAPDTKHKKTESNWSVAYMVSQLEGKTAELPPKQLEPVVAPSLSPVKPQKRKSLILRRFSLQKTSDLSRTPSVEQREPSRADAELPSSPAAAQEFFVDVPPIPATRRSSFTPGAATRKLSPTASSPDIRLHKIIQEEELRAPSAAETEYFDWEPPRPRSSGRAGTPSDMGYAQLGALRHGSLQIVNGRASPTFSEISKVSRQLLAVQPHPRDVSSEYGDADDNADRLFTSQEPLPKTETQLPSAERRLFSWEHEADSSSAKSHPLQTVVSQQNDAVSIHSNDAASILAKEYMDEIAASPFEQQRSTSPTGTLRRTRSEGSLWLGSTCSAADERDLADLSPVSSIERSNSPTGSVIRNSAVADDMHPQHDGREYQPITRPLQPCESAMSWHSAVEPSYSSDEAYHSTSELPRSKASLDFRPHLPRAPEKSDSGYSSSTSLRSLQAAKRTPPPTEFEALPEVVESPSHIESRELQALPVAVEPPREVVAPEPSRTPSFLRFRPSVLLSRKTDSAVPTLAGLKTEMTSSSMPSKSTSPAVKELESVPTKTAKERKKLMKKRRPLSQTTVPVSTSQSDPAMDISVPPVTPEACENLRLRSQAVPELSQTYIRPLPRGRPASDLEARSSRSEVRFPSPNDGGSAVPVRRRSLSRPRSWFNRSKSDYETSKRNSGISEAVARAIIHDFGTDGAVLGRSPYDLSGGSSLQSSRAPSRNSSVRSGYRRYMMDDETAAELSRIRREAVQERDNMMERQDSFRGIPGRKLRPQSLANDAPPITQEMLEKFRTSSMQRFPSVSRDVAPPPPPHSPQPTYIEHDKEEEPIAPPPPSHSPRPMDITPDPWAAQAAAWQARRQSLGENLKRRSGDTHDFAPQHTPVEESLYPEIPLRRPVPQAGRMLALPKVGHYPSQQQHTPVNRPVSQHPCGSFANSSNHSMLQQRPSYVQRSRQNSMNHESNLPHDNRSVSREPSQSRDRSRSHLSAQQFPQRSGYHDANTGYDNRFLSREPSHSRDRSRSRPRPQPSPRHSMQSIHSTPYGASPASRPHSKPTSVRSYNSSNSLAEDLHPADPKRAHPPPAFGRYSGGMGFGYERGNGFGGAAGTRSVSSKGDASRKGVPLRATHGVDLGDVPVGIMAR